MPRSLSVLSAITFLITVSSHSCVLSYSIVGNIRPSKPSTTLSITLFTQASKIEGEDLSAGVGFNAHYFSDEELSGSPSRSLTVHRCGRFNSYLFVSVEPSTSYTFLIHGGRSTYQIHAKVPRRQLPYGG